MEETTTIDAYLYYMFFVRQYDEKFFDEIKKITDYFIKNHTKEEIDNILDNALENKYNKKFVEKLHNFIDKILNEGK